MVCFVITDVSLPISGSVIDPAGEILSFLSAWLTRSLHTDCSNLGERIVCARRSFRSKPGLSLMLMRRGCADRHDGEFDIDRAGILEYERHGHPPALLKGLLQPHHHQVEATRRERDGGTGRNRKPALDLAHAHDAAFHLHLMDLHRARGGALDRD